MCDSTIGRWSEGRWYLLSRTRAHQTGFASEHPWARSGQMRPEQCGQCCTYSTAEWDTLLICAAGRWTQRPATAKKTPLPKNLIGGLYLKPARLPRVLTNLQTPQRASREEDIPTRTAASAWEAASSSVAGQQPGASK